MRSIWKDILIAVILGMVVPWMVLTLFLHLRKDTESADPALTESVHTTPQQTVALQMYLRCEDGTVTQMDLDTYLTGVILAELPASFEQEAKKAQAVAARTFTWKAVTTGGKHGDGSVCTDSRCCQAYISPELYSGSADAVEAAWNAVISTSGYVLTYQNELIEATYFSCSGGSTEDAVAVWGTEVPYLHATDSPGEEDAAHYSDETLISAEDFLRALNLQLSGEPSTWLGMTTYTAGGGVAFMEIGGQTFKGTELRTLLGLKSTAISIKAEGSHLRITTRGYGHRVGMSQYGADAMAAIGCSYSEILAHYYQGAELTKLEEN